MNPSRFLRFWLACAALSTPALAQMHLLVDDDPAPDVDYSTVAEALGAIAPGGTIEVRAGEYLEFLLIDGRSISILAHPGVNVRGEILVRNLAPDDVAVLRGIHLRENGSVSETVRVQDCQGLVRMVGCTFVGSPVSLHTGPDTMIVEDSVNVILNGCTVTGGTSAYTAEGGRAVRSLRSDLNVVSSRLIGGRGTPGNPAAAGGPSIQVTDGHLFGFATVFRGGPGGLGQGPFGTCGQGGDGGTAIRLSGTDPVGLLIGCRVLAGLPGEPLGAGACSAGSVGPPPEVDAGVLRLRSFPSILR